MRRLIIICLFLFFLDQVSFLAAQNASPSLDLSVAKGLAWTLGGKLGLAAFDYARGVDEAKINDMLSEIQPIATELGIEIPVPAFPTRSGDHEKDRLMIIGYVDDVIGLSVGKDLQERYSKEASALFIMSIVSYSLVEAYEPLWPTESPGTGDLAKEQASIMGLCAKQAELPESLWEPLTDQASRRYWSKQEVWYAVQDMEEKVEKYLEQHQ
jgi:hypothetical protein